MVSADGSKDAAERAVGKLAEMSADLRSCAIVAGSGEVLAESAPNDWGAKVAEIWSATSTAAGADVNQVHVATGAGELFATRAHGLTAIALSDRFTLASLMFCDLRATLRDAEDRRAS